MSLNVVKIFKLNFDGTFDEIAYENIKEVFTIVNILAIYVSAKKIMYVWIGSNATQALKNHISNIRVLVKEEFPDFRIMRNFTFEMRDEPFDFFKNLNFNKEDLYKSIDYQEKVMLPTLKKIDHLKKTTVKLIDSEEYSNAIKNAGEIIKLAEEIKDDALQTEQKGLITELTKKSTNKTIIDKIIEEALEVDKEFSKLITAGEYLKAHAIVEEFEKKNSTTYDLSVIKSAKELISKEKKIWKKEQERLVKELTKLENDLFLAIKNLKIENAIKIMERGKSLFPNLINDEIKKKWEQFEQELQIAKQKAELVKKIDDFIKKSEEMKVNYQFNAIKKEIVTLLENVQKLNIPDYQKKLEELNSNIISTEEEYDKTNKEIESLENDIKIAQEEGHLDKVLKYCEQIIQLAKKNKKSDLVEKYSHLQEQAEKSIEERKLFEEKQKKLELELKQLEGEFSSSLKVMDLPKLEKIIEKSKLSLIELVDEEIKKNWVILDNKHNSAKKLIEDVEKLGEKGLGAIEDRSYRDSLEIYERIIEHIKIYNE